MRGFSYVVARDFGFAPNPFDGVCTLATCKQQIRDSAAVGDWVIGTGSARFGLTAKLVFAMEISKRLTFNAYWNDERFATKKPVMNGSLKKMYGDNIYRRQENGGWEQANSHHSLEDGRPNAHNVDRDTSADAVLIANHFYYFGKSAVDIPKLLARRIVKRGIGYRCIRESEIYELYRSVLSRHMPGYHNDPNQFVTFERYDGTS